MGLQQDKGYDAMASDTPDRQTTADADLSFKSFYDLMPHRVNEILLVSSPYDAFIMDEDGRLAERIIHEYGGLNLTRPPRLTWVSSTEAALEALSQKTFDLVITMPGLNDMDPQALGLEIKNICPDIPLFLLAHDISELPQDIDMRDIPTGDHLSFDQMFIWSGDTDLLLAMIKTVEDRLNATHDTEKAKVRVVILVEDSAVYSGSLLPQLYEEIVTQTQAVMDDSLNEEHKILRMRARPKVLLARNFEQAMALYQLFAPYLLGILSDVRFPRNGKLDDKAGFALLSTVKETLPDLPLLMFSSEETNREEALGIPAAFLNKNSPTLNAEIGSFFVDRLGFGDFFFRLPGGAVIERASNLQALEKALATVPDDSLYLHATQNDFSSWLMARSEVQLALNLRRTSVAEFDDIPKLREYLVDCIRTTRLTRQRGVITDFSSDAFDPDADFVKLGTGSIGGKARGLAFISSLLKGNPELQQQFPGVRITIPKTLVITTEGFDAYMKENVLENLSFDALSDARIVKIFTNAPLPEGLRRHLESYLDVVHYPLAIRSSSLLEDARNQPCAGIYQTHMIPNNDPDIAVRRAALFDAIKRIYASTYLEKPRAFIRGTQHRVEDEKMAVILQQITGAEENGFFYPAISGVAQSHNFYPISHMKPEDGIVHLALGLGKTVVEGASAVRFSPEHPEFLPQFSTVDDILKNAQRSFYALNMAGTTQQADTPGPLLEQLIVDEARTHFPVRYLSSTYSPQDHRIRDALKPGEPPVVTFANILKHRTIPLPEILVQILDMGRKGMASPVEIEFSVSLTPGENLDPVLSLLQIR
ncbi:MAG: PEP/pyruvate-binding domain-containing protein, partial [Desulfobacterales bacterium]